MNHILHQKAQNLKERIAQLRASRQPDTQPPEIVKEIIAKKIADVTIPPVYTSPPEYVPELDQSGKPIDLVVKYGITQEVCITFWEYLESTQSDEFEERKFLDVLERGMIISLSIQHFSYFKILKICGTDGWNDIFIVNFKYKNSKPAKTALILKFQFPLKPGNGLVIISLRNQHQLWNMHIIDAVSINKKTFLEKTLERFWF